MRSCTQEGQTAIMQAAAAGKRDTVEYLIKQGASLAFQDSAGNTVLHHACEVRHRQLLR